jgi:hypothetical protein
MAKKTKRRVRLVKLTNGLHKPFRRGDTVTLMQKGKRTALTVSRVLGDGLQ